MHWVTHTLHAAEKKIIETEYMSGGKEYSEWSWKYKRKNRNGVPGLKVKLCARGLPMGQNKENSCNTWAGTGSILGI